MDQDHEEKGEEENDEETEEENEDYETLQMWQNQTNFSKNKNENKIDLGSRNEQLNDNFKKKHDDLLLNIIPEECQHLNFTEMRDPKYDKYNLKSHLKTIQSNSLKYINL